MYFSIFDSVFILFKGAKKKTKHDSKGKKFVKRMVAVSTLTDALQKFEEEGEEVPWTNIPHNHSSCEEEILEKIQKLQQLQELKARLEMKALERGGRRDTINRLIEM